VREGEEEKKGRKVTEREMDGEKRGWGKEGQQERERAIKMIKGERRKIKGRKRKGWRGTERKVVEGSCREGKGPEGFEKERRRRKGIGGKKSKVEDSEGEGREGKGEAGVRQATTRGKAGGKEGEGAERGMEMNNVRGK
jgi:hypothetical protein